MVYSVVRCADLIEIGRVLPALKPGYFHSVRFADGEELHTHGKKPASIMA